MNILITGGTGTLGKQLVAQLYKKCNRIVIYSRDEFKQAEMKKQWPEYPDNILRYFIGDVRDIERLKAAMVGIDFVIHTAAMKRIEVCEYDPGEAIKTNIVGTVNVSIACNRIGVRRCMLVSTDKAVDPINLYGFTKGCAEKMAVNANALGSCRFSVCRYGNVEGSRGSVFDLWRQQQEQGKPVTITSQEMTRFFIKPEQAAAFVVDRLNDMQGGEIFVPKMPRFLMAAKMAEILHDKHYTVETVGLRPGEKIHETLISQYEVCRTYDNKDYYIIYPDFHDWTQDIERKGKPVDWGFTYTSKEG